MSNGGGFLLLALAFVFAAGRRRRRPAEPPAREGDLALNPNDAARHASEQSSLAAAFEFIDRWLRSVGRTAVEASRLARTFQTLYARDATERQALDDMAEHSISTWQMREGRA